MTDQFSPASIFKGHWAGLRFHTYTYDEGRSAEPDKVARAVMLGFPLAVGGLIWGFGWTVGQPEFLVAGVTLLTAGFLGSFSQIASWRSVLDQRQEHFERREMPVRDNLDIIAAHLSVATYLGVALVLVLIGGANFTDEHGVLLPPAAAVTAALGMYLVLIVLMIVPLLYEAYLEINRVDPKISGQAR